MNKVIVKKLIQCIPKFLGFLVVLITFFYGNSIYADVNPIINTSSTANATLSSTMRHVVYTSDGTIHAFIQVGTQSATCGGVSRSGLLWFYSTDSGANWTCQSQLSSDTTTLMYASISKDSSDNIYMVYSTNQGLSANANADVYYRKLTKGSGATWTVGAEQKIIDSNSSVSHGYATLELQGTTRIWFSARYYNGTLAQTVVYYSDGLGDTPTWTQSSAGLIASPSAGGNMVGVNQVVRFGSKIGIIYIDFSGAMKWRHRNDSDGLTDWSAETAVSTASNMQQPTFSAVGDSNGRVYYVHAGNSAIFSFSYWNGSAWSTLTTISTSGSNSTAGISLSTDGYNVWVTYGDTSGLSTAVGLSGNRKIVYKKGVPPYTATDFDTSATSVVSHHGTFDKYWSFVSSTYTDDTIDIGSSASADTQLVTNSGDIAYFGKTEKFDSMSWDLSTNGTGGTVSWEYCSAVDVSTACTTWSALSIGSSQAHHFTNDGSISFTSPVDWTAAKVNSESTAYYYVRARATGNYSVTPIGIIASSMSQINYIAAIPNPRSNSIPLIWTENTNIQMRIRSSSISVTTSTPPSSTSNLDPAVIGYSSIANTNATQTSSMKNMVKTSDGTIHVFFRSGTQAGCGGSTSANNNVGIQWMYSSDSGSSWTCGGQINSDSSTGLYPAATVDSSDNIYVINSAATNTANSNNDINYVKLTKGSGASWTIGSSHVIANGTASVGYHYGSIVVEGSTRLWIAGRYFDGTNYQVVVYYSNGMSPTQTSDWTQSSSNLDTPGASATAHYPVIVRYGTKIGVIYTNNTQGFKWRNRDDTDGLTSWTTEADTGLTNAGLAYASSAVGDSSGNIYLTNNGSSVFFTHYNGSTWSSQATVSSASISGAGSSIVSDGTNVWVWYLESTGLLTALSGNSKLVYKKGVAPFATANFDSSSTTITSYHGTFDKYWSYVSGAYTNDTTDSANTTSSDTQMVTGVGDMIYVGKTDKFDSFSWAMSTTGVGGHVVWEYYNGSTWTAITDLISSSNSRFITGNGFISFTPNTDWATTSINGEGTAYYYIRARVTTAYTTTPVGTQFVSIPRVRWPVAVGNSSRLDFIWTENDVSTSRIRYSYVSFNSNPSTPTSLGSTSYVDGSFGSDNTPTFSFTLSDTDVSDTVKYRIQIDESSDFSSPIVDYTSALAAQGPTSFTVGQSAGSGTYTVGSPGQTLTDRDYYWRVKAIDDDSTESSYATANSGSIAFKIDTIAPTIPGTPSTTSPTSDSTPTWTWTGSLDSGAGLTTPAYMLQWSQSSTFSSGVSTSTSSTTTFTHSTPLGDGTWYLRLNAMDSIGNTSSYSSNGSVVVNTGAPTGTIQINNGAGYTSNRSVVLTVSASSGFFSGTDDIDMKISNLADLSDGIYEDFASSKPWTLTSGDGTKIVYVQFKDSTNNESGAYTATIILDNTSPLGFSIISPGNNSYISTDRPSIKWRTTTDSGSGLSSYKIEVESEYDSNGNKIQFNIDDIPTSRTSTYENSKYIAEYEGFSDSDQNNNYITVTTKSSILWGILSSDGTIKEGKRIIKVRAVDNTGNTREESHMVFNDRTSPTVAMDEVNSTEAYYVENELLTTDSTPTLKGTVTDLLSGDKEDNKVASGPKEIIFNIKKKNIFGIFEEYLEGKSVINLTYSAKDSSAIIDNSVNTASKYAYFDYTTSVALPNGSYEILLKAKDNAGNTGSSKTYLISVGTYDSVATANDKETVNKIVDEEIAKLRPKEKHKVYKEEVIDKVKKDVEITRWKPISFKPISFFSTSFRSGIYYISKNTYYFFAGGIKTATKIIVTPFEYLSKAITPKSIKQKIESNEQLQQFLAKAELTSAIWFKKDSTQISNLKVENAGRNFAIITWTTNHPATSKVSYGSSYDYGQDVQSTKLTKNHKVTIRNLKSNTTYYYEVMSAGKTYVFDARHEFNTKK